MSGAALVRAADLAANHRSPSVCGPGNRRPKEPSAPVEIPFSIERAGDSLAQLGTTSRGNRNPPEHPVDGFGKGYDVADRPPELRRGFGFEHRCFAIRSQLDEQPFTPKG